MTTIQPSQWKPTAAEDTYISSSIGNLQVDNARKTWSFNSTDNNDFRFEVRKGDQFSSSYYTDSAGTERNNVQELTSNKHPISNEVHVQYKMMIEPGAANTAKWVVLSSLKGFYPQDWSAPFEVALRGEKMAITGNYEPTAGNVSYRDLYIDSANIQRGKWYDMKIDVKFDPTGNGHIDVWRDGTQIVDYSGKTGYQQQTAYLWKEGIYRSTAPETLAVHIKDLQLDSGANLPDFPTTTQPTSPTAPTSPTVSDTSSIVVNARGTAAGGVNAHFKLLVDGQKVGEGVTGSTAKDFTFSTKLTTDVAHKVQVQYDNDATVNGQDRNLIVNKITINGHAVNPTDGIVTYDKGALDGKDVVAGQSGMWWNGTLVVSADKSFFPAAKAATLALADANDMYAHLVQPGAQTTAQDNQSLYSGVDHPVHLDDAYNAGYDHFADVSHLHAA